MLIPDHVEEADDDLHINEDEVPQLSASESESKKDPEQLRTKEVKTSCKRKSARGPARPRGEHEGPD